MKSNAFYRNFGNYLPFKMT